MSGKPIGFTFRALRLLVAVGLVIASQRAGAAEYNLRAASTTLTMPDGTQVPMWGFGLATDTAVSVPGPVLEVPPGDTTLIIHLTNELPEAISIVIPGIPAPLAPVWNDGTTGPRTNLVQRAVSFTHVAQPGETVVYQWDNLQPGTYLYHSGTHPSVQVPMGLYGVVRHDATIGQAYDIAYDRDQVLVYSEVDPALNDAVATGTFGTPGYPSTIGYRPRFFLINGEPTSAPPALQVEVNERLLLRVVNAGLRSVVPTLAAGSMSLLAEDGHRAPFSRDSYAMLLPAGKTRDALLVIGEPGGTVLFDRRGTGQLLRITAVASAPVAVAETYDTSEDTVLDTVAAGLPGVLANDTGTGLFAVLDTTTASGTLALAADGSFTYTPDANFTGTDSFSYHASDGTQTSGVAIVTLAVAPVNDVPVAVDDAFVATDGAPLVVDAPGVLGNDSDADGDAVSAELVTGPSGGMLVIAPDGAFQYIADPGTTADSFTYQTTDGLAVGSLATVTITVQPAGFRP